LPSSGEQSPGSQTQGSCLDLGKVWLYLGSAKRFAPAVSPSRRSRHYCLVREGNNNIVKRCDEIWVFGAVSNGVLAEIQIANDQGKAVRFFKVERPHRIIEITKDKIEMEVDVTEMRHLL
jgi:hypothetical protein